MREVQRQSAGGNFHEEEFIERFSETGKLRKGLRHQTNGTHEFERVAALRYADASRKSKRSWSFSRRSSKWKFAAGDGNSPAIWVSASRG